MDTAAHCCHGSHETDNKRLFYRTSNRDLAAHRDSAANPDLRYTAQSIRELAQGQEPVMKPVPLSEWDTSLDHVVEDMSGRPLNVHSLLANHPELLNAWWNFRNYVVRGGTLRQRDCELVILRVAVHMRSWYEWASHVDRGLAAGLSIEEIERVRQSPNSTDWNECDALLLLSVDELVNTHAISSATQQRLSKHFSTRQVMDVIAIHGMYITLSGMLNTWSVELDESVQGRLPDSVTRGAFEQGVN